MWLNLNALPFAPLHCGSLSKDDSDDGYDDDDDYDCVRGSRLIPGGLVSVSIVDFTRI